MLGDGFVRTAYLMCRDGVAGDMWLGALVDAGVPVEHLQQAVDGLGVGPIGLHSETVQVRGVAATRVHVTPATGAEPVRTWPYARSIIESSELPPSVRTRALAVYRRLAEAEAKVHGCAVDDVRFHELGSLDTIADIVGACAGVEALGLDRLLCGPVGLGAGSVATDHGVLPVPAPAVVELLNGFFVEGGDQRRELATPTGAALVAELTETTEGLPPLRLVGHGRGVGDTERASPSVLTLLVGEAGDRPEWERERRVVLEATIDDLVPQLVPVVIDRLLDAGARDAWAVPVLMKKGRPGFVLTALTDDGALARLAAVLFTESSTIGVRWHTVGRQALARRWATVEVDGQKVRIKIAELDGDVVNALPEFEDVRAAAELLGRPVKDVYTRAAALASELRASSPE
jgi:uncharacterized protein (TIGR00299 family) protein